MQINMNVSNRWLFFGRQWPVAMLHLQPEEGEANRIKPYPRGHQPGPPAFRAEVEGKQNGGK
jgi:hypothetical protein